MENKVGSQLKEDKNITVTLALLRKDLIKSVLLCEEYGLVHKIIDENNLKITISKDSIHLLYYIGTQVKEKI